MSDSRNPAPPHRYEALDGLRGAAALAVMLCHLGLYSRGYLAVDFFMALSGFVIDHAYRRRLEGDMGLGEFMKRRLIRLYPSIFAGMALGAVHFVFHHGGHSVSAPGLILIVGNLLLLPMVGLPGTEQTPWPIDPPAWSLVFELGCNGLYGLRPRWITRRTLAIGLALGLPLVVWGMGSGAAIRPGAAPPGGQLLWITARMTFSFLVGIALHRLGGRGLTLPSFLLPLLAAALLLLLAAPTDLGPAYDAVAVVALFPALVWTASLVRAGPWTTLCRWSGALAYPLYCVHVPVSLLGWGLWGRHGPLSRFYDQLSGPGPIALSLVMAFAVLVLWETPVRAALARRRRAALAAATPA